MRVIPNANGTFSFEFNADEKNLGISILKSIKTSDVESQAAILVAIQDIMLAGVEMPSQAIN